MTLCSNDNFNTSTQQSRIDCSVDFKKKRCLQLQKLSNEHNECILFAEKIAQLAADGSVDSLTKGIQLVQSYNATELEAHLKNEEQTIFAIIVQQHKEHIDLCITLGKEHGFIRTLVEEITLESAQQDLADFAHILKNHTLEEETKLFPIVESLFTQKQLDAVSNFIPWQ